MEKDSATPGVSFANFATYLPPTSDPVAPWSESLLSVTVSIDERVFNSGPTCRPTWAAVTGCLPLFVTVPDTVSVSPSVGALGLRVSTATDTDPESSAARAGAAVDSWHSPASRGAPASRAPVRRSQRRAGEGLVPWKSAASATRSPVPRRRQWSSDGASTHGNDAREG